MNRNRIVTKKRKKNINKLLLKESIINNWQTEFDKDPVNRIIRNAIVTVGSNYAATDVDEARKIDHIFTNSIKTPDVRATDQLASGRCWIFAGLNVFRHMVMKAMQIDDFEFSQTYLFFYDKLEKSNMFLIRMIELRHVPYNPNNWDNQESRYVGSLLTEPIYDGGYWSMFANLVDKYGLVPSAAMPETFQSGQSEDMNYEINHRLRVWACLLRSEKLKNKSDTDLYKIKEEWVQQIYNILVKYMGHPPKSFQFSFRHKNYTIDGEDEEGEGDGKEEDIVSILKNNDGKRMPEMTPMEFKNMLLPDINLSKDFITLGNYPKLCSSENKRTDWYHCYQIEDTTNVEGGEPLKIYNIPIEEMKDFASTSINFSQPVWFGADVCKGFDFWYSSLDEKLIRNDSVFGSLEKIDKGDRLLYHDSHANHAMTLTGVDFSETKGESIAWQVENSWGYYNPTIPGLDGFLYMSDDWFDENVFQIVILKKLVEAVNSRMLRKPPIILKPWNAAAQIMTSLKNSKVNPRKPEFKRKN